MGGLDGAGIKYFRNLVLSLCPALIETCWNKIGTFDYCWLKVLVQCGHGANNYWNVGIMMDWLSSLNVGKLKHVHNFYMETCWAYNIKMDARETGSFFETA